MTLLAPPITSPRASYSPAAAGSELVSELQLRFGAETAIAVAVFLVSEPGEHAISTHSLADHLDAAGISVSGAELTAICSEIAASWNAHARS